MVWAVTGALVLAAAIATCVWLHVSNLPAYTGSPMEVIAQVGDVRNESIHAKVEL